MKTNNLYNINFFSKTLLLIVLGCFNAVLLQSKEPDTPKISNISFSLTGNNIVIHYDILDYEKKDKYYITLEVYNTKEEKLRPLSLEGDVNTTVYGGNGKTIVWHVKNDYPNFNDSIYVKIMASVYTYKGWEDLVLWPTLYPGASLYKHKGKKAWLLLGVASYGSLGAALLYNNMAKNSYDQYKQAVTKETRDKYFQQAGEQRKLSNQFFYSSLGLWIINYGVTYFLINNDYKNIGNASVSLIPGFSEDSVLNLKFTLNF